MSQVKPERMTAQIEGDFVVFLIGLRINKPWKVHKWWPVASAMPKMLRELDSHPEYGLLGYISGFKVSVQYWRSFEHLESYATSKDSAHLPAWKAFNQSLGQSQGDVGIWHETYQVRAGDYETIYSGMPPFGLGAATSLVSVSSNLNAARSRMSS